MTLKNLLQIGQLKEHTTDSEEMDRLLAAADRNLSGARLKALSPELRFDAAYKTIMQVSLAALMANGYRPDTKKPGHHATVIQSLPKTLGVEAERIPVLDALRKKRNLADYTGDDVDERSVAVAIDEARKLLAELRNWLEANRPDLTTKGK
jgi:hypothetical protein